MRALTRKGDREGRHNRAERKRAVRTKNLGHKGERIDLHERKGDLQGEKKPANRDAEKQGARGKATCGGEGDLAIRAGQLLWPGLFG